MAQGETRAEFGEKEKAILDFEGSWWQGSGPKEIAIRERLRISPTRYYAVLQELMDSSDALDYNPLVVKRLQRMRERRRRARYEGKSAGGPTAR